MAQQEFQVQAMFKGTILSHGYGFIAQKVMRDKNITYPAKAIYSYLASFSGVKMECFPSVDLMQAELGMPEKTFYKHLRILKDMGLVTTERIRNTNSKFKGTLYTLIINEREIEEIIHTRELMGMEKDSEKIHTHEFNGVESNGVESNGVEFTVLKVTDLKVPDIKIDTTTNDGQVGKEIEIDIPEEFKTEYVSPTIDQALGRLTKLYEGEVGRPITRFEHDGIMELYDLVGEDLVTEALKRAVESGTRDIKYIRGIVSKWRIKGIKSLIDVVRDDKLFNDSKLKSGQGNKLPKQGSRIESERPIKQPGKYDKFYIT